MTLPVCLFFCNVRFAFFKYTIAGAGVDFQWRRDCPYMAGLHIFILVRLKNDVHIKKLIKHSPRMPFWCTSLAGPIEKSHLVPEHRGVDVDPVMFCSAP